MQKELLRRYVKCKSTWNVFWNISVILITFNIQNWFKNKTSEALEAISEAYAEPCQTFKMEIFANIVNGFLFLFIFAKSAILDVWQDSEFASEPGEDFISDV